MAEAMILRISTPEATLLEATGVISIQVRIADLGSIGIHPGHAPLLAETAGGPLRYSDQAGDHSVHVEPGILEVRSTEVDVLTSGAQTADQAEGVLLADGQQFDRLARALLARLRAGPDAYAEPDMEAGDR